MRCILTAAGAEFVTPLSVASLSGEKVFTDLFSLTDEAEMGHIRLSREADLVVVAPATADLIAKMANGLADDLASTALLATDKPVLIAPAMNPEMWRHPATRRNVERLRQRRHARGRARTPATWRAARSASGRMAEPGEILAAIEASWARRARPLARRARPGHQRPDRRGDRSGALHRQPLLGQAGPRHRRRAGAAGAEVTLVSGPVLEPDPAGVRDGARGVGRARCCAACQAALPVDVAVCAAAVADWRVAEPAEQKLKKRPGARRRPWRWPRTPTSWNALPRPGLARPALVIGFAAETEDLLANARRKLAAKGCDWILANDVSTERGTFGGVHNTVKLVRGDAEPEAWPKLAKADVAARLVERIAAHLQGTSAVAA